MHEAIQSIDGAMLGTARSLASANSSAPLRMLQMDGRPNIVLDLSGLSFIDSIGLKVLVGAHRRAKARGGSVVIRGASHSAIRLLQLTALDRQLMIAPDSTASGRN